MLDNIYFAPVYTDSPYYSQPPTKAHPSDAAFDLSAFITPSDLSLVGLSSLVRLCSECILDKYATYLLTHYIVVNGSRLGNISCLDPAHLLDQFPNSIILFSPFLLSHLQSINPDIHVLSSYRSLYLVGTGFKLEMEFTSSSCTVPAGLILPRSGLASKFQLGVANSPGLIDAGYRGEIKIALENKGFFSHIISPGSRISQLLITQAAANDYIMKLSLSDSDRGTNGFGSSGVL